LGPPPPPPPLGRLRQGQYASLLLVEANTAGLCTDYRLVQSRETTNATVSLDVNLEVLHGGSSSREDDFR
jgi:hypothetical protein